MLKADYVYRGKDLKPKLELKAQKLQVLKEEKQKEIDKLIAETPLLPQKRIFDQYQEFTKDDPKLSLEAAMQEIKFQINKCNVLILECMRSPRMKFTLDLEEVIWLYN